MPRYLVIIRNPRTDFMKEWYLDRIHWTKAQLNCLPVSERIEKYSDKARNIESSLRQEAIVELYEYIIRSVKTNIFVLHFIEMENNDNYCICKCSNNVWWLYYLKTDAVKISLVGNNNTLTRQSTFSKYNPLTIEFLTIKVTNNSYVAGVKIYVKEM